MKAASGQASVECAFLLPILLLCLLALLQPACLLYGSIVSHEAAHEACRLLSTLPHDRSTQAIEAAVKRRLSAVPSVPILHVGGPEAWEVELVGNELAEEQWVVIEHRVRPLPLLGSLSAWAGLLDQEGCLVQRYEVQQQTHPDWRHEIRSGEDPWSWIQYWH